MKREKENPPLSLPVPCAESGEHWEEMGAGQCAANPEFCTQRSSDLLGLPPPVSFTAIPHP